MSNKQSKNASCWNSIGEMLFHPGKGLGKSEVEATALALELNADWLLMDDLSGRREAIRIGLTVMGTVGVLIRAKQESLIEQLEPLLDELGAAGFRFSRNLRLFALQLAGELS